MVRLLMQNYYMDLLESDNYRVRNLLFDVTREVYGISRDISFDDGVRTILAGDFESRQAFSGLRVIIFADHHLHTGKPGVRTPHQNHSRCIKATFPSSMPPAWDRKEIFWEN